MSLSEYTVGGHVDFFVADDSYPLDFPCCACKHRFQKDTDHPCLYCGHRVDAEKSYNCSLCGEFQPGDPFKVSHTIANGTAAQISYVCETCLNTIRESFT